MRLPLAQLRTLRIRFASMMVASAASPASRLLGVMRCLIACAASMVARASLRSSAFSGPGSSTSTIRSKRSLVLAIGGSDSFGRRWRAASYAAALIASIAMTQSLPTFL